MKLNLLAFAIPFFVLMMIAEYYFSRKRNKRVHQFEESIANLNVGIAERLSDLLTTGSFFFVFAWIYKHYALFEIKSSPSIWVLLFLATDFLWYWYHRIAHEVNLFWSVHVVHHQSEDFNYTASVRVTVFQAVARGVFWSVLPLIGFPPEMIYILLLLHGTYPFFTHTELVGKLGWLEYFLVTPSHHRVHHSSNPEYLDKNFGDVLIVWDKIFGTFAAEKAQPIYGLTKPLASHSFLWQHFHFMLEMSLAFKRAVGWKEKLRMILGNPNNIDPRLRNYLERKLLKRTKAPKGNAPYFNFLIVQTIVTLLVLFLTILLEHYLSSWELGLLALFILFSVISSGALIEQSRWIFSLELLRVVILGLFVYSWHPFALSGLPLFICLLILLGYCWFIQRALQLWLKA